MCQLTNYSLLTTTRQYHLRLNLTQRVSFFLYNLSKKTPAKREHRSLSSNIRSGLYHVETTETGRQRHNIYQQL